MKQNLPLLACLWAIFAGLYAVAFFVMVTVDIDAARARFDILVKSGRDGRAISHGEQIIALHQRHDNAVDDIDFVKRQLAVAHRDHGDPLRAAALLREVTGSAYFRGLPPVERMFLRDSLARLLLRQKNAAAAAAIYADFLDAAGDDAAQPAKAPPGSLNARYLGYVIDAASAFTEALPPVPEITTELITDRKAGALADHMTDLGGFYADQADGIHAAAGLLAKAHQIRGRLLGEAHARTIQTALLLGPVYQKMGRLREAEKTYLRIFHAQERAKGPNNPELSLYLRLLIDLYIKQERYTEAEALNIHVRGIFKDAFGARRYIPNQLRDRREDVSRPVSRDFELDRSYQPTDLVSAGRYNIPLSKPSISEEMQIRLAREGDVKSPEEPIAETGAPIAETRAEAAANDDTAQKSDGAAGVTGDIQARGRAGDADTLPAQLEALIALCMAQTGENISLRSGFRSYNTQVGLYKSAGRDGMVTAPGTSEHQLGLAVDIDVNRRFMRRTDAAFQCFTTQAWQYGFILTYPPGNTYLDGPVTFEPWHWRYVSRRIARLFREIGPLDKPQEFLAALPCYEERAQAGQWRMAGEEDVCLKELADDR